MLSVSSLGYTQLLGFPLLLGISYAVYVVIYNLYFHPLKGFPGPRLAAATPYWFVPRWLNGRALFQVKELHDRYGTVVRTSPNELSFCAPQAWKDIYGAGTRKGLFIKSDWYKPAPGEADALFTVRDPEHHGQMRKQFSHDFSAKALAKQQDVIQHFIDMMISQLDKHCTQAPGDMKDWYNFCTFDIIGDLAFGESFGSTATGKPHFWISILFASLKTISVLRAIRYLPPLGDLFDTMYKRGWLPSKVKEPRRRQIQYSDEKLTKRINSTVERNDLMVNALAAKEKFGTSYEELRSQATTLVIAGSETTATALLGMTYFLARNPESYSKLAMEVRSSFSSYDEITGHSTEALPYLQAAIWESLRMYPPVPIGMPRVSPGDTVDGRYVPKGAVVYSSPWAATKSESNFHKPYEYIPERWLDAEWHDNKEASQPFSLGSRGCLGRNLGHLEMRLIMAKILWTFDFRVTDDHLDWTSGNRCYMLWDKPSLPVQFTRRAGITPPAFEP
ncbi:MAG: hypothetical protein LQ339_005581 [Xanthoria mediterranea]|nr:MAG: hypothetical protein LQ339_005581 [Xanthoria mediterranea]